MIRTLELSKVFRTETIQTTALNKVSFSVETGEFVAIMGPSGCGKSTLLNILGLLDEPDGGEYYFDGTPTAGMGETNRTRLRKGKIGFVFQNFNLIEEMTVFENVELPLLALRVRPAERKRKVQAVLERVQIGHRKDHFPQQLSGGQQQRVAIARAVVAEPSLVLADEPTGNLDSANGEEVIRLLEQLNESGTTIVMVTHSRAHADRAHRTVNLLDGQLVIEHRVRQFHIA